MLERAFGDSPFKKNKKAPHPLSIIKLGLRDEELYGSARCHPYFAPPVAERSSTHAPLVKEDIDYPLITEEAGLPLTQATTHPPKPCAGRPVGEA